MSRLSYRGMTPRGWAFTWARLTFAVAALMGTGVWIASAAATAARQPIRPGQGRRFVPATGDWEGTVEGLPASFELFYAPSLHARYGTPPYAFSDLVIARPQSCMLSTISLAFTTTAENILSPVRSGGSFGLSGARRANLTAARSARLAVTFVLSPTVGVAGCSLTRAWTMHPAHRLPVSDGTWRLRYSDGASSTFQVSAGGRLASGVQMPSVLSNCGFVNLGAANLFITAPGLAVDDVPQALELALHFSGESAVGRLTTLGGTCPATTLRVHAQRVS